MRAAAPQPVQPNADPAASLGDQLEVAISRNRSWLVQARAGRQTISDSRLGVNYIVPGLEHGMPTVSLIGTVEKS